MRTPGEIGESARAVVEAMNSVSIEEIDSVLADISRETSLGPMIDPTAWRRGKFEEARLTKKVMQAIRGFKVEVSGIGSFDKICEHE